MSIQRSELVAWSLQEGEARSLLGFVFEIRGLGRPLRNLIVWKQQIPPLQAYLHYFNAYPILDKWVDLREFCYLS